MNIERKAHKLLREILDCSDMTRSDLPSRVSRDPSARKALEYLEAKAFVKVTRAWGGDVMDVVPLPSGIAFFTDRRAGMRQRWADRFAGFVVGVAASVAAHFIIQAIQAAIR